MRYRFQLLSLWRRWKQYGNCRSAVKKPVRETPRLCIRPKVKLHYKKKCEACETSSSMRNADYKGKSVLVCCRCRSLTFCIWRYAIQFFQDKLGVYRCKIMKNMRGSANFISFNRYRYCSFVVMVSYE